ncbi:GreA/GreB family elongation factor [Streptomyces sp. NPDC005409]|uniref:GreA/GreB family elongation factor n=1 Tax=Streptomyces sp. NPDC005409 TaxID=3155342 RepID=UPI00345139CC
MFGATVTVLNTDTSAEQTLQIVGEDEADDANGLVSVHSPLASALIGKNEGDSVEVQLHNGAQQYKILTVAHQ